MIVLASFSTSKTGAAAAGTGNISGFDAAFARSTTRSVSDFCIFGGYAFISCISGLNTDKTTRVRND